MKYLKYSLSVFILTIISQPVFGQQSIGFSDSTDFQYIIDYRLPDWGYSNFFIEDASFGSNGQFYSDEGENYGSNSDLEFKYRNQANRNRVQLNLTPAYQYYLESEQRILDLTTRVTLNGNTENVDEDVDRTRYRNNEIDSLNYHSERVLHYSRIAYFVDFSGKHYMSSDFFLLTGLRANLQYRFRDFEGEHSTLTTQHLQGKEVDRDFEIYPELGIGFGRLRNVTPQLRALRMNERYKSLGQNSLQKRDIIEAAEQFTKISGYQRTTDRYRKYFWSDMNQLVSNTLDRLGTYDLFYLTDVLNENLGQRFEGFEAFISGTFNYQSNLRREERTEDGIEFFERDENNRKNILGQAEIRWFKNLSLDHQLSVETISAIELPLDSESTTEWTLDSFSEVSWLWTITDRYLLNTTLSSRVYKPKYKPRFNDADQYNTETYLASQLSYFIENKLALTARASFGLDTFDIDSPDRVAKRRSWNWGLSAGFRYYFNRNLY